MPSVLFLPDLGYDHRIWADIPSSLAGACDVVSFDAHVPMPWAEPDSRAFLDAVCRLVPDPPHSIVVAAGLAAGFAVHAALSGQAGGLVLFQPASDYIPPEAMTDVPVEDLLQAAAPYAGIIDASRETDVTRRTELVTGTWRGIYGPSLTAPDLDLACQVIGEHVEDLLAALPDAQAATGAGEPPRLGLPWAGRLDELEIPVTVVSARRARRLGHALAQQIPNGQFVAADADTDLVWLKDRTRSVNALRNMLALLS
jgi:hypothetical protein